MGYLNESGLAKYDGLIKSWVTYTAGTVEGSKDVLNWQKTASAGAVSFYPVPVVPLEPTVNFLFTETPPSNGQPKAPDNPSTITGVSNVTVTRCGKNLCPVANIYIENGAEITVASDVNTGEISISGTPSNNASIYLRTKAGSNNVFAAGSVLRGGTYTFSFSGTAPSSGVALKFFTKETASSAWAASVNIASGNSSTYSIPADLYSGMLRIDITANTALDCLCFVQMEEGSTVTSFEPYAGTDYTVNLGNTYYGGSLDVSTGVLTVTHVAVTPDSSTVDISSNPAALPLDYADTYGRTITSADGTSLVVGSTGGTVVYKLAAPQTVTLTPTQIYSLSQSNLYTPRLNTVYSDQTSVQVGYPKSPIYSAQELTNAIISLGGNV